MKLSVSLQLLDLGEAVGLLGWVISSSQGLYLYTNTEKRTYNTNTKQPCPEEDSNPQSRRSRERRQFMPDRSATVTGEQALLNRKLSGYDILMWYNIWRKFKHISMVIKMRSCLQILFIYYNLVLVITNGSKGHCVGWNWGGRRFTGMEWRRWRQ
jgi:hypothetical protein